MKTEEANQGWKAAMLVGAVMMIASAVTCSASISMSNSKSLPWLAVVSVVGFIGGLWFYVVGRVALWWRDED